MMSDYVAGYLLMIERHILSRWQAQQNNKWDDRPYSTMKSRIFGLLGVGTIGAHLDATAHHFGMRVYGYTRQSGSCKYVDRYFHGNSWPTFAAELDYLVCSLPGINATKGIIDAGFLSALPVKVWLVNVGRGSTVDETALIKALNRDRLEGAILDVIVEEPLPEDHPFWTTANTFITSHTAASNYPPDIASIFIKNYKLFIRGEPRLYQVSFERGY
jgi:phosphoglycerate dehydrogenase-like enzyme